MSLRRKKELVIGLIALLLAALVVGGWLVLRDDDGGNAELAQLAQYLPERAGEYVREEDPELTDLRDLVGDDESSKRQLDELAEQGDSVGFARATYTKEQDETVTLYVSVARKVSADEAARRATEVDLAEMAEDAIGEKDFECKVAERGDAVKAGRPVGVFAWYSCSPKVDPTPEEIASGADLLNPDQDELRWSNGELLFDASAEGDSTFEIKDFYDAMPN